MVKLNGFDNVLNNISSATVTALTTCSTILLQSS